MICVATVPAGRALTTGRLRAADAEPKTEECAVKRLTAMGILLSSELVAGIAAGGISVVYTIETEAQRAPISPYIYGSNPGLSGDENLAARRSGGNRLTGYNWENNYSNAGSDWYHHSDRYLVQSLPGSQQLVPGIMQTRFHDSALAAGQLSVVTLQMAGFVAADDDGTVDEADTAPSDRWKQVVYAKGAPFCNPPGAPDTDDAYVYMDECVNYLVSRYGGASSPTGAKCYSLDNEPALWASTHPRIHPEKLRCEELITRSVALSEAVKDVDPNAQILGPVLYGFNAYLSLQDAPDWADVKDNYDWFIDYYLDQMRASTGRRGRRLLDVLDLHWYPEARGDGRRITESQSAYSRANAEARMQAPRTLWDPDYTEDSWIATWFSDYLPLLPNILNSIESYYPGTKLSITEYSYGAPDHISGGIAMADVLGIFGEYGMYLSTYWHLGGDYDYVSAAYRIYRNYDGANSTFGDTRVYSQMSDKQTSSVYASVFEQTDWELHVIVINKNFESPIEGSFTITSKRSFDAGRVWAFDGSGSSIREVAPVGPIVGNSFSYTLPALSVCHIVLVDDCPDPAAGDLSGDCDLNWEDVDIFAEQWLDVGGCSGEGCADLDGDTRVDFLDFALLCEDWGAD